MDNHTKTQPCSFPIAQGLSREVATWIQAVPKACWKNSVLGLIVMTHQHGPTLYVEGWVADKKIGFSFEHGWLEHDGQIVEPTLILSERTNGDLDALIYYPGIRYSLDKVNCCIEAQREMRRNGDEEGPEDTLLPFAFWNSPGGACTDPSYRRAWEGAFEEATGIAPYDLLDLGSQVEQMEKET